VFFVVTAAAAALLAGSAGASTIYDNGPINGTIVGFTINFGYEVADSFTVSSNTSAWDMSFGTWNIPGDSLQSVDWAIYDGNPFTGSPTLLGSGTATAGNNFVSTTGFGYNLYNNTISLGGVALASGTYWIQLSGAVTNTGDPIYWDDNNGASSAWQGGSGGIGDLTDFDGVIGTNSEAFSIGTPEPATWALMLAGFAGLGAALRSRRKLATA
jgi:hypothetical protein